MNLTPEQIHRLRAEPPISGNRIAAALKIAGLTQTQLADALGERAPRINDMVRGRYNDTSLGRARKFAEFFGCAIEDLFPSQSEAKAS